MSEKFSELHVKFEEYCRKITTESKFCNQSSTKEERIKIFRIFFDDILKSIKARFSYFKKILISFISRCSKFQKRVFQLDNDAFNNLESR